MKLTTEQLELISKEIIEGGIKYQDLYEELLDHYILAIEDRMSQGQTFGEAFGEVHSEFVNYKRPARTWDHYGVWETGQAEYGLGKLQAEYIESLTGEISKRHWEIIKNYFRWPTIVTTLLVGLLTFQFAYLVPRKYLIWPWFVFAFLPMIALLPQLIKTQIEYYIYKKKKFASYLKSTVVCGRSVFGVSSSNLIFSGFNISQHFFEYNLRKAIPISVLAIIICFYIAYSLSFYQLYRERFKVTMA